MQFHPTLLLIFALLFAIPLQAQQKKKIPLYELDVIQGLFFQPNTIDPYSGTAIEEYADGRKKMQVPIKNGKINGVVKEWAVNGQQTFEAEYIMGAQTGVERQWFANGNNSLEISYADGKPHGMCVEWYKNGQKKSEGRFINGKEEGEHLWWFSNGQLDQQLMYKNGKAEGLVKNWYETGQLKMEAMYQEGLKDGQVTLWFANGQKQSEGTYEAGKENGEELTWSKSGLLEGKKIFEKGNLIQEYNYRSGSIYLGKSYLLVVNEKESFFTIEVKGESVSPRWTSGVSSFTVDGLLLQLFNYPLSNFVLPEGSGNSESVQLEVFQKSEAGILKEKYGTDLDWQISEGKTKTGKDFLYWSFPIPATYVQQEGVQKIAEEHFLSLICNKQVLNLHSVVMEGENADRIRQMLQNTAETLNIKKDRIDLNTLRANE